MPRKPKPKMTNEEVAPSAEELPKPELPKWVWFDSDSSRDANPLRMAGDNPARLKNGTLLPINQAESWQDIEVFMGDRWVPGMVVSGPKTMSMTLTFASFKELKDAVRDVINQVPFLDVTVTDAKEAP